MHACMAGKERLRGRLACWDREAAKRKVSWDQRSGRLTTIPSRALLSKVGYRGTEMAGRAAVLFQGGSHHFPRALSA